MVWLTTLLTPLCILAGFTIRDRQPMFLAAFLALQGLVNGLFVAQDMLVFYLFWEAMLIPMFLIIGIWGGENRVYATLKFFLYTFVGSVLMLVAILWMWAKAGGTFDMAAWTALGPTLPANVQGLLWLAFFAAFAVKVPMWPFHTWLPDAHVQAPTAGSVILAGVLLKLGAYGFLRLNLPMLPDASADFAPFVFTLSGIAVVYAALVAFVQTDIKKLIAYSSVSHMGLVTLGIFAGTQESLEGAYLVMLNHGIVSAGLFLAVGVIYERFHTREIANFGGLAVTMPKYAFVAMVLTLAAVALPGTNSFVGEFLVLAGSWNVAPVATLAGVSGVVFGALYMLWFYRAVWFGAPSAFAKKHAAEQKDLTLREMVFFAPLIVLVPVLGIVPHLAQRYIATSLEQLAIHTLQQPAVQE
jgi:NADH-quinone oxidoreductase subunit M